jgi:hypothetical protein
VQVGKAYVFLARVLQHEGSRWSLTMAQRALLRAWQILAQMKTRLDPEAPASLGDFSYLMGRLQVRSCAAAWRGRGVRGLCCWQERPPWGDPPSSARSTSSTPAAPAASPLPPSTHHPPTRSAPAPPVQDCQAALAPGMPGLPPPPSGAAASMAAAQQHKAAAGYVGAAGALNPGAAFGPAAAAAAAAAAGVHAAA